LKKLNQVQRIDKRTCFYYKSEKDDTITKRWIKEVGINLEKKDLLAITRGISKNQNPKYKHIEFDIMKFELPVYLYLYLNYRSKSLVLEPVNLKEFSNVFFDVEISIYTNFNKFNF